MGKFLVAFARNGRLIWRVGEGRTRGEARIDARNKEWNRFRETVLKSKERKE